MTDLEVAALVRVHRQTVIYWRSHGGGPPFVQIGGPGGTVRYRRVDVERWLADRTRTIAPAPAEGGEVA